MRSECRSPRGTGCSGPDRSAPIGCRHGDGAHCHYQGSGHCQDQCSTHGSSSRCESRFPGLTAPFPPVRISPPAPLRGQPRGTAETACRDLSYLLMVPPRSHTVNNPHTNRRRHRTTGRILNSGMKGSTRLQPAECAAIHQSLPSSGKVQNLCNTARQRDLGLNGPKPDAAHVEPPSPVDLSWRLTTTCWAATSARPYVRWFQGVIASLRRVSLMVSGRF
jgi:hypothetical protein